MAWAEKLSKERCGKIEWVGKGETLVLSLNNENYTVQVQYEHKCIKITIPDMMFKDYDDQVLERYYILPCN